MSFTYCVFVLPERFCGWKQSHWMSDKVVHGRIGVEVVAPRLVRALNNGVLDRFRLRRLGGVCGFDAADQTCREHCSYHRIPHSHD
jgi:hypothetical protein